MRQLVHHVSRLGLLATLGIAGCVGRGRLETAWADPLLESAPLHNLVVLGVARNTTTRRTLEDQATSALRAQGIEAQPSYALVGDGELDSARLNAEMHRIGCEGVFVTRVVDRGTVAAFRPSRSADRGAPAAYRLGWYTYFVAAYAALGAPRYTHENEPLSLEANLYRVSDGKLVWSAASQAWLGQPQMPGMGVGHFARQLASALRDSRVVERRR